MKTGTFIKLTATACLGLGAVHGVEALSAHTEVQSAQATADYLHQEGLLPNTVVLQSERANTYIDVRNEALVSASADTVIAGALFFIAYRGRREKVL